MKEILNFTWTQTFHQEAPIIFKHNNELLFICESSKSEWEIKIFKSDFSVYRDVSMAHSRYKYNVYRSIYGVWVFPIDCHGRFLDEVVDTRILVDDTPSNDIVLQMNCKRFLGFLPNKQYLSVDKNNTLVCKSFSGDIIWKKTIRILSSNDLNVSVVGNYVVLCSGERRLLYVIDNTGREVYELVIPQLRNRTYAINEESITIRGFEDRYSLVYKEVVFCKGILKSNRLFSVENFNLSHFNLSENVGTLLGITEKNGATGTICWNIELSTCEFKELFFRRQKSPSGGDILGTGDCVLYCEPHSHKSKLTLYSHGKYDGELEIPGYVFEGNIEVFENSIFVLSFEGTDKLGVQTYRIRTISMEDVRQGNS